MEFICSTSRFVRYIFPLSDHGNLLQESFRYALIIWLSSVGRSWPFLARAYLYKTTIGQWFLSIILILIIIKLLLHYLDRKCHYFYSTKPVFKPVFKHWLVDWDAIYYNTWLNWVRISWLWGLNFEAWCHVPCFHMYTDDHKSCRGVTNTAPTKMSPSQWASWLARSWWPWSNVCDLSCTIH